MEFKKISASQFGCLKEWECPDLKRNLIVFYGPNESGKSTIFNLITTLIYGWNPSSRESNQYIPWDSSQAMCTGTFFDSGENEFNIVRRLKSKAEGNLINGSSNYSIGNSSIPQAGSLSRELFKEVYALTLDELRFPDDKLWQKMQDQLLGGQFDSLFNPIRDVVQQLESEANNLWRHDRRGNPKERGLLSLLGNLNIMLKEARDREERLHNIEIELDELWRMLDGKLGRKSLLTAYIDRFERLYPIMKRLNEIKALYDKAGNITEYDTLPADILNTLNDVKSRKKVLYEKKDSLDQQIKKLQDQVSLFSINDMNVCSEENKIKEIVRWYSQINMDIQNCRDLDIKIHGYESQLLDRSNDFLSDKWDSSHMLILKKINLAELKASIETYNLYKTQAVEQKARIEGLKARKSDMNSSKLIPIISSILLITGISGILLSGLTLPGIMWGIVGGLGLALAVSRLISGTSRVVTSELKNAVTDLKKIDLKKSSAQDGIRQSFYNLPVTPVLLDNPDEELLLYISKLKDIAESIDNCNINKNAVEKRLKEREQKITNLMRDTGIEPANDILSCIDLLEKIHMQCENRRKVALDAEVRIEEAQKNISEIEKELNDVLNYESGLLDKINKMDGTDLNEKINNIYIRRKCWTKAEMFKNELEVNNTGLEQIIHEVEKAEKETWAFNDNEVAQAKTERDQLDVELNQLNERIGSLKKDMEYLQDKEKLDDIEGQIEAVKAEADKARINRDRIALLRNILIDADKKYREEHQPDILKKAGRYLGIITGGRYDMLYMNDEGKPSLSVRNSSRDYPVEVGIPLSRGTKEQIYLSLRLALIEHLDNGTDKLPVFLDETLVNWDNGRLNNMISIIDDITKVRQVFLFTCHDFLVDKLRASSSMQVIELGQ